MSESEQYTRLAFMLSLKDKNIHHHQMRFSLQGGCAGQQCRVDGLPADKVYFEGSQPFCNEKTVCLSFIFSLPARPDGKSPFQEQRRSRAPVCHKPPRPFPSHQHALAASQGRACCKVRRMREKEYKS